MSLFNFFEKKKKAEGEDKEGFSEVREFALKTANVGSCFSRGNIIMLCWCVCRGSVFMDCLMTTWNNEVVDQRAPHEWQHQSLAQHIIELKRGRDDATIQQRPVL